MNGDTVDNIDTAIEAGKRLRELELAPMAYAIVSNGRPYFIKPTLATIEDAERWLPAPVATRATVALADADSFVAYVKRFADAGTVVFADLVNRRFEAVIDYHQKDEPRWCRHRATFACALTPDWLTWSKADKTVMDQEAFGLFLESNIPNIAEPAAADLVAMSLTLDAKKAVEFRSSTRLSDGQVQFKYEESIEGRATGSQGGELKIPHAFVLGLVPFVGMDPTKPRRLEARFRYRIQAAKLSLWFELVRPEEVLRTAFEELTAGVRAGLDGVPLLSGSGPVVFASSADR